MTARIWAAGLLAVVGGLLIIASGFSSHGFILYALGFASVLVPSVIGGLGGNVVRYIIAALALLVALGGMTVVLGGILILAKHMTMGRLLIMLGGGAGFLGLLISFGYIALANGTSEAVAEYPYWLGLILAILGRRVAKGAKPRGAPTPAQ
jgi:hypothetical protein